MSFLNLKVRAALALSMTTVAVNATTYQEAPKLISDELTPKVTVELRISGETVSYRKAGQRRWELLMDWHFPGGRTAPVIFAHLKGDGTKDVLVKTSEGRSDTCYAPFMAYVSNGDIKFSHYRSDLCGPKGPTIDEARGAFESIVHNGPFVEVTRYTNRDGVFRRVSTAIPFDYDIEIFTTYAPSGASMGSRVRLRGDESKQDVMGCVKPDRLPLYTTPRGRPALAYIVSNDRVTLVDAKEVDGEIWLRVVFNGRQTVQGWVLRDEIEVLHGQKPLCTRAPL
ncbi:hypothetical protein [Lysobacter arvi]|uniref:SH3 domain-containing protein n=1 Tax=Lysobacter arvi TaxID=3038776 RepID=A0ABU1CAB7_9GAMM|nr:hypothetical protein [Lysobacter arvi]MDR0182134.1 hypothetical protein [Lysobacter arvi]